MYLGTKSLCIASQQTKGQTLDTITEAERLFREYLASINNDELIQDGEAKMQVELASESVEVWRVSPEEYPIYREHARNHSRIFKKTIHIITTCEVHCSICHSVKSTNIQFTFSNGETAAPSNLVLGTSAFGCSACLDWAARLTPHQIIREIKKHALDIMQ